MKHALINRLASAALIGLVGVLAPTVARAQGPGEHPVLSDRAVLHDPEVPSFGNPGGDVTVVEFFDYQCPFCRKAHPDLTRLVAEDGKVRVVLKDWPILSPSSRIAAQIALAAKYQGKYAPVHAALMEITGRLDQDKIRSALVKAGVDLDKLNADLKGHAAEIEAVLARNNAQAEALGLSGTPGFLIGPFRVPGTPTYQDMKRSVAQARERATGAP